MISLERLKAHLGSDVTADDDALLVTTESEAVALVSALCGDWFGEVSVFVDVVDGLGGIEVWCKRTPLAAPTVEQRFMGGAWSAVSPSSITSVGRRVLRTDGGVFGAGALSVRLTYEAGYDPGDDVPQEVFTAVLDATRFLFREGRSWTLKDLALPDVQTRPAGVQHIASVRALIAARWKAMV